MSGANGDGGNGDAWGRRPNEGERPWALFTVYRDLPPSTRSLPMARELAPGSPSISLVKRWSARWQWRARAAAYDAHRDSVRLAALDDHDRDAATRTEGLREQLHARMAAMIALVETPAELLALARAWDLAGASAPEPATAIPAVVVAAPAGWRMTSGAFPVPVLDIETSAEEDTRRARSVLTILADAGVIMLPDSSTEPGFAPREAP